MFEVLSRDGKTGARRGMLKGKLGTMETPGFLPVATKATAKCVSPEQLASLGAQGIISNSFILSLRPGVEVVQKFGGLHQYMNWKGVIFTDSGGFQLLNPELLIKVKEEGVLFRDPYEGQKTLLTPKLCAEIQMGLGSDVAMVLDDCKEYGLDREEYIPALERTTRWAREFKERHDRKDQFVFGITQGGTFHDLRRESIQQLEETGYDGYGIGGLCIGEPKEVMAEVLKNHVPDLPEDSPRYLMGVGSPVEMLHAISCGVDVFDSVLPTRNARHNTIFTRKGRLNIGKGKYSDREGPLDENCQCYACQNYSFSYVNHLLREYEYFGMTLASIHNLHFLQTMLAEAREAIEKGEFGKFREEFLESYRSKLGNGMAPDAGERME